MRLALLWLALAAGPALAAVAPAAGASAASAAAPAAVWSHAYAAYGEPKYPAGFDHFDYADPQAKKGGTLYLSNPDLRSSFDKYNYYTIKGQSPAGINIWMMETLAIPSGDEPGSYYGLVAEAISVAPDRSSISFRIHSKARFNNGDAVTAADVKYVFDSLTSKYATPEFRSRYAGVERAVVVDERTIRFELKDRTIDTVNSVATLPVFSRKWGLGADGKTKPFDEIINEPPITTGPYRIALADSGRRIEFERRPDYWARDLGVRRGFFNFDRVVYRYYQDGAVAMEAFKAGEFNLLQEYSSRRWAQVHAGAKWRDGRIRKELFPTGTGAGLQSYQFNLRRPIFADIRVREAIELGFDFSWINKRGQYLRTYSVFSNSQFAAQGLPSPGELKLLEPYRTELPPAVFGPPYEPARTDTGPIALRENLRKARDLLAAAGYTLGPDGVLRNAAGLRLEFELMDSQDGTARTTAAWRSNLAKLGVMMRVRQVDSALDEKRREVFDFDMIPYRFTDFTLPSAAEYNDSYSSKAANEHGSANYRGIRSKAVDAALAAMNNAHTMQELQDACRALDRVVMHSHWQVPDLYSASFRVSYWDRFERPKKMPLYYTIDSGYETLPQWPLITWWIKPR
jgi:peptide/nickel transport system substrate-binding protein/microcin C transport system substrate-binding protein